MSNLLTEATLGPNLAPNGSFLQGDGFEQLKTFYKMKNNPCGEICHSYDQAILHQKLMSAAALFFALKLVLYAVQM